jgi:hypothetical protein
MLNFVGQGLTRDMGAAAELVVLTSSTLQPHTPPPNNAATSIWQFSISAAFRYSLFYFLSIVRVISVLEAITPAIAKFWKTRR